MGRRVLQSVIDEKLPRRHWDWRYERALELSRTAAVSHLDLEATDDEFVMAFTDMLRRLNGNVARREKTRLKELYRAPYDAWDFYTNSDGLSRDILEAFLLSGSTDQELAENFSMSLPGVRWYEKMFCDVRSRINKHLYIVGYILHNPRTKLTDAIRQQNAANLGRFGTLGSMQEGSVYKLLGYYGGPIVLELVYTGLLHSAKPTGEKAALAYINKALSGSLRTRGLTAARVMEVNKYNVSAFIDTACKLVADAPMGDMNVVAAVGSLVETLNISCQTPMDAVKGFDKSLPMLPDDSVEVRRQIAASMLMGPVEPRAHEINDLGRGVVNENWLQKVNQVQMAVTGK